MLYDIVVNYCNRIPFLPIHLQLMLLANVSTQFVYDCCRSTDEVFKLVTKDSCKDKDKSNQLNTLEAIQEKK